MSVWSWWQARDERHEFFVLQSMGSNHGSTAHDSPDAPAPEHEEIYGYYTLTRGVDGALVNTCGNKKGKIGHPLDQDMAVGSHQPTPDR